MKDELRVGHTYNFDLQGVHDRCIRMKIEMIHSQSSNLASYHANDIERLVDYLNNIEERIDWAESQPLLDFPYTSPVLIYKFAEVPVTPDVENLKTKDLLNLTDVIIYAVEQCQSRRYTSGMHKDDLRRIRDIITKKRSYIDELIIEEEEIDFPESSPNSPMVGNGRQPNAVAKG